MDDFCNNRVANKHNSNVVQGHQKVFKIKCSGKDKMLGKGKMAEE